MPATVRVSNIIRVLQKWLSRLQVTGLIPSSRTRQIPGSRLISSSGHRAIMTSLSPPKPPFAHQSPVEINNLIQSLRSIERTPNGSRRTAYHVPETMYTLDCWKFNDNSFKRPTLPIYARGLFTLYDSENDSNRIALRGYDKFFDIRETYRTEWDWITQNTQGPYEATMKENGCIILISGLQDGTLLVTSKHAIGDHAGRGRRWVDRQLEELGKKRSDLALALYQANATAVAELCDDTFEEHVIPYEGDSAGLYLHGINLNLREFVTYSVDEVAEFADKWGFKKITLERFDTVSDVKKFLETVGEKGNYKGKEIEGFVIRCKARSGPDTEDWNTWFFKYKFEEPYLMYQQWREATRDMIQNREPRIQKHFAITREYLQFANQYFFQNPGAVQEFEKNRGIIRLRNAFLAHRAQKGNDTVQQGLGNAFNTGNTGNAGRNSNAANPQNTPAFSGFNPPTPSTSTGTKLVLIPIATIGCGKTTLASALVYLFNWGHIQNDNITPRRGQSKAQAFCDQISQAFRSSPVVIADRNNHQKRERQQLFQDLSNLGLTFIALHWVHYHNARPINGIRNVTHKRVFERGDGHQTIRAETMERHEVEGIMEGFLRRFQPVNMRSEPDNKFAFEICLHPRVETRRNLETVVKVLRQKCPMLVTRMPTGDEMDEALREALKGYTADTAKETALAKEMGLKSPPPTGPKGIQNNYNRNRNPMPPNRNGP